MKIIQPYDLTVNSIEALLNDGKILLAKNNKQWRATIFPKSTELNIINNYDKDNIITQIDDILFDGFTIVKKINSTILLDNTKRDYIKCIEIGDFNDSVKRYIQLDKPIDYVIDAQSFINLPTTDNSLIEQLNVNVDLIHNPNINTNDLLIKKQSSIFETEINHPHINIEKPKPGIFKNNNKAIIEQIFRWAKDKGIKYIYSINEHRPYVISMSYVSSYIYYTITGSY